MTSLKRALKFDVLSNAWLPPGQLGQRAPAHVKNAEKVARGLRTPTARSTNTSPAAAVRLVWLYKNGNPKKCFFKNGEDELYIASARHIDTLCWFNFLGSCIVKVLRPKRGMPEPRVQFSLCGVPTMSTRMRLNRYAIELGVKFFVWQDDKVQWCLWVKDGMVQWAPMGPDDKVIATNF